MIGAARQGKVSATNGEAATPGWVAANLWFGVDLGRAITLSGGVENMFDRRYADHLAGRNRVGASDVPVGERLPGPGRGVWARITAQF